MDTGSFTVYIKTEDIYSDIAKTVEIGSLLQKTVEIEALLLMI